MNALVSCWDEAGCASAMVPVHLDEQSVLLLQHVCQHHTPWLSMHAIMTACHVAGIGTEELAQWFDAQNRPVEDLLQLSSDADIISFSHFLPLQVRPPQAVLL